MLFELSYIICHNPFVCQNISQVVIVLGICNFESLTENGEKVINNACPRHTHFKTRQEKSFEIAIVFEIMQFSYLMIFATHLFH